MSGETAMNCRYIADLDPRSAQVRPTALSTSGIQSRRLRGLVASLTNDMPNDRG
jgi:hypothetical protein